MLAITICSSFFIMNSEVSADWYEFYDNYRTVEFFPNEDNYSFAEVSMTFEGDQENDTDLAAFTHAENVFWWEDQIGNTTEIDVYVSLAISFNFWHPNPLQQTIRCGSGNSGATASVFGATLDDEDHYVEGFTSSHTLTVWEWVYNEESGQLEQITYQWGPSIYIGTSS